MKFAIRTTVMLLTLFVGTGLAIAAHAAERGTGGHIGDRATRYLGSGHPVFGHHGAHRGRHHGHGYGHRHHRYRGGHRHQRHYLWHGQRYRHYRKYAPRHHYRHRYDRYRIWFELDGVRYYIAG